MYKLDIHKDFEINEIFLIGNINKFFQFPNLNIIIY